MALWLAGSLALLGKAILAGKFQGILRLKIAEKSPQNRRKIRGNFGGFEADFGTAETKTKKPKTQPHRQFLGEPHQQFIGEEERFFSSNIQNSSHYHYVLPQVSGSFAVSRLTVKTL